ncbi:MAG: PaaI family thioesterase [Pseudomonadota bacterium]|nr:PaaI family thioesterase [Pseudomonadota bacterium]
MSVFRLEFDSDYFNGRSAGFLPGLLGVRILEVVQGRVLASLEIRKELHAPNGFLHAGTVVTLADTACGYGCVAHLPAGAKGFTTIELKSNHLGTALDGVIEAQARAVHLGRSTQIWDATVTHKGNGKTLALFRCTQMIL